MGSFMNLRTTEIPEIGIMGGEIRLILDVVSWIVEKNSGYPKRGTFQMLWQKEGCKPKEVIWCNFAEGRAEYQYRASCGCYSCGDERTTDRMVTETLNNIVIHRKGKGSGISESWQNYGVENALILNVTEGRMLVSINTTTEKFVTRDSQNNAKGSVEQQMTLGLLAGIAEVLNALLEVNALYRLGLDGDVKLRNSIEMIRGSYRYDMERTAAEAVRVFLAEQGVSDEEKARREKVKELKDELRKIWMEKILV